MNSLILWIIAFPALGGALSVRAAGAFLLLPERARARMLSPMVSFAIGALLGAAFLAILPHAFEVPGVDAHAVTLTVLCGILVFFVLEKMVIWRHCHTQDCDVHGGTNVARDRMSGATDVHGGTSVAGDRTSRATEAHVPDLDQARQAASGNLILIGDGIHNMVDGGLIAAAVFIYIAVADLIPGLQNGLEPRAPVRKIVLFAWGVTVISWRMPCCIS